VTPAKNPPISSPKKVQNVAFAWLLALFDVQAGCHSQFAWWTGISFGREPDPDGLLHDRPGGCRPGKETNKEETRPTSFYAGVRRAAPMRASVTLSPTPRSKEIIAQFHDFVFQDARSSGRPLLFARPPG